MSESARVFTVTVIRRRPLLLRRLSGRFSALLVPTARGWHCPPPRSRCPAAYDIWRRYLLHRAA